MTAEAESLAPILNLEKCTVVLVDVLGTTTSINFMKETLAPFVVKHAEEFLKTSWEDEVVKEAVKDLKEGAKLDVAGAAELVKDLTEKSSENKSVKTLQGLIYKKGYSDGELKGHVFADVPSSFELWAKSRKVAVFSTGSAESQKQLFTYSTEGDLTPHISNYFDLTKGPKTEADSYKKIVEELKVKSEEVVFVTDDIKEAKAAKEAGLSTAVITREGNEKLPEESQKNFTIISSFKDLVFESSSKRKITEEETVTSEAPPAKLAKTESSEKATGEDAPKSEEKSQDEAMDVDQATEAEKEKEVTEEETSKTSESNETKKTDAESTEKTEKKQPENDTAMDITETDASVTICAKPVKEVVKEGDKTKETIESEEIEEKVNVSSEPEKQETKKESVKKPEEPVKKAVEPVKKTEEPVKTVEEPVKKVEEPVKKAEEPVAQKEESAKDVVVEEEPKPVENKQDISKENGTPSKEKDTPKPEVKVTKEGKDVIPEVTEKEIKVDSNNAGDVKSKEDVEETKNEKKEGKTQDESTKSKSKKIVEKETTEEDKVSKETVQEESKKETIVEETKKVVEVSNSKEVAKEQKVEEKKEEKPEKVEVVEPEVKETEKEKAELEKDVEKVTNAEETKKEQPKEKEVQEPVTEEKESKCELTNGVNGKAEETKVTNGDAGEKVNGNVETKEDSDAEKATADSVEEIKVKKIEDANESAPSVSVEV